MSLTLGLADRIGLNGPQVVRDLIGQQHFEAHAKEMGGFPMVWPKMMAPPEPAEPRGLAWQPAQLSIRP